MLKMQKQTKGRSTVSRKRQIKTLPEAVPEPKTIKLGLSDIKLKVKPEVHLPNKSKSMKTNVNISKKALPEMETKPDMVKSSKIGIPIQKTESEKPNIGSLKITKTAEPKQKKKSKSSLGKPLSGGIAPKKKKKKSALKVKSDQKDIHNEDPLEIPLINGDLSRFSLGDDMFNDVPMEEPAVGRGCGQISEEVKNKYPILKNDEITSKFLKVPMSNNQKGRIRQAIKLSLQDMSQKMYPDIINNKIQGILDSSLDLTDSDLRRIRILYNMLKTALDAAAELVTEKKSPKKKKSKKKKEKVKGEDEKKDSKDLVQKVKGPKRYVVFLGNLPLNIDKQKIMDHFREFNEHIKDVRFPKLPAGTKSAIAFLELNNEPSYELALSKHHSMLGTRRIKVLYTAQQNSKITKREAKAKSAKIIALQKAGKLLGSAPMSKKRSHRRAIMKKAKAKEAENA